MRKNVEKKLQELQLPKTSQNEIVADIFGRKRGNIFESGLTDARSDEAFDAMLGNLEERWSSTHAKGKAFFTWFQTRKRKEFLNSVIRPVRQRAGLGSPPDRFTTNRSEQTNRSIQEFVKSESKGKKVDEFTFCVALSKLINQQEQAIELAILGLGEYKLRDKFKHLGVSSQDWEGMRDEQKKKVLDRLHKVSMDEASSNTTKISKIIRRNDNTIMEQLLDSGVDWIPREILCSIVDKAMALVNKEGAVSLHGSDTIVVESASNPRKPHVVNLYPNGKTECDCAGFLSSSVCAHSVAACVKQKRIPGFCKWLSSTKRNIGGINFSKAITFGMPKGRGRKGEKAPRKVGRSKVSETPTTVLARVSDKRNCQSNQDENQQVRQSHLQNKSFAVRPSVHSPQRMPQPQYATNPLVLPATNVPQLPGSASYAYHPPMSQYTTASVLPSTSSPAMQSSPVSIQPMQSTPGFPSPISGKFMVYLLQFCPGQTSTCFGCGNPLKQGAVIPDAPNDLVVVSKMQREWMFQGRMYSKISNVYFHCATACILRKQPNFVFSSCFIAPQIEPFLLPLHRDYIRMNLGGR